MENKLLILLISLFTFGFTSAAGIMKKESLTEKEQKIVMISAFTAGGNLEKLNKALNEGLDAGLTVNEIKEVLVHLYAYSGFPRSLNGLATFMEVLKDREARGIKDQAGKNSTPIPKDRDSVKYGTDVQTELVGMPVTGEIYNFAPDIDEYLKGHLFGDIFGRDILDYRTREIVTISALASMNDVNPQLAGHFNIGMNTGITKEEIEEIIVIFKKKINRKQADNAEKVFESVQK